MSDLETTISSDARYIQQKLAELNTKQNLVHQKASKSTFDMLNNINCASYQLSNAANTRRKDEVRYDFLTFSEEGKVQLISFSAGPKNLTWFHLSRCQNACVRMS